MIPRSATGSSGGGAGADSPWLAYARPRPAARVRLFCIPFAGGGASAFRSWPEALPETIEVLPVQPPGREGRIRERAFTRVEPLVEALAGTLDDDPGGGRPYALFGHSMGTLIGYELARTLRRQGRPGPVHLFVSAHRAPHRPSREEPIHALPEPEFRDRLRRLNGTPEAVLEHPELMELLGPLLRADFALDESYRYREGRPLDCPITAFGGDADSDVPTEELSAWSEHTRARFRAHVYPGDHFFLHGEAGEPMRRQLTDDLLATLDLPSGRG